MTPAALTTVSLFLKCKAADVRRGSDRGEWNVGAISHTHTHTPINTQTHTHGHQAQPPRIRVKSCCCLCLHLIHRSACGTSPGFSSEDVHTSQCQLDRDGDSEGLCPPPASAPRHLFMSLCRHCPSSSHIGSSGSI